MKRATGGNMLDADTQRFIAEVAMEDEELADDYANHAFYCHFHYSGVCSDPEGKCSTMQSELEE